jgi:hypothetical protein
MMIDQSHSNFPDIMLRIRRIVWYLEECYSKWNNLVAPFARLRAWMERIKAVGDSKRMDKAGRSCRVRTGRQG